MYAIIVTGGKQYRVKEGQVIQLEKLERGIGERFMFDKVLVIGQDETTEWGAPYLVNAVVEAEVLDQGRGKKIHIIKFRRRTGYRRKQGHRQSYTEVKITKIATSA